MGKASSTKKVARAARAGGNRRAGQRRNLGFPLTIGGVVVLGLLLIGVTRQDRIANAAPRVGSATSQGDHWHVPYSTYTCVPDPSTPVTPPPTTTTSTSVPTATTAKPATTAPASGSGLGADDGALPAAAHLGAPQAPAPTSTAPPTTTPDTAQPLTPSTLQGSTTTTVVAQAGDVAGVFQAPFRDAGQDVNGIHTHGDGVMHVHPFNSSSSGRNAQIKVFMRQVGVTFDDTALSFADATTGQLLTYKSGKTKCQGGKVGIVQVGVWDRLDDAANGKPPNQVITHNVGDVRLKNAHAIAIAFLPKDSRIPIQPDVKHRYENLTDVTTTTTTTAPKSSSSSSSAPASTGAPSSAPTTSSATFTPASSSSS